MVTITELDPAAKTEESKSSEEANPAPKGEIKSDALLLGLFEYKKALMVALGLLVFACIWICIGADQKMRNGFLLIAFFNCLCLGATWLMRN